MPTSSSLVVESRIPVTIPLYSEYSTIEGQHLQPRSYAGGLSFVNHHGMSSVVNTVVLDLEVTIRVCLGSDFRCWFRNQELLGKNSFLVRFKHLHPC